MHFARTYVVLIATCLVSATGIAESSAFLARGLDAAQQGNCRAAEPDLRRALVDNPRETLAYTALGVCASQSGHPELATSRFEAAARLDPQAWQVWNNLGANYLTLKRFAAATEQFRRAVAIDPRALSAWCNLSASLLQSGDKLMAFRAIDHAEQLAPEDAQVVQTWLQIAGTIAATAADAIEKEQYAAAVDLLMTVRRPLERSASWNNLIGYSYFKLNKSEDAKTYLETALEIEPDNESYLLDVGQFLAAHRAYSEAAKFFEVGIARMPHSGPVRFGLAISYMLEDRTSEAIVLLEHLRGDYPHWILVDRALGECYEAGRHWTEMIRLGQLLEREQPQSARGWYLEGEGRAKLADEDHSQVTPAIDALRHAVKLEPSSSNYHFHLGKALEQDLRFEQAIPELKEAIRLEPESAGAHYALARAYKQTGEERLAARQFQIVSGIKTKKVKESYVSMLTETARPSTQTSASDRR